MNKNKYHKKHVYQASQANAQWEAEVMRRYNALAPPALVARLKRMSDQEYVALEMALFACREKIMPIRNWHKERDRRENERAARALAYQMAMVNFNTADAAHVAKYDSDKSPFAEHSRRGGQRSRKQRTKQKAKG